MYYFILKQWHIFLPLTIGVVLKLLKPENWLLNELSSKWSLMLLWRFPKDKSFPVLPLDLVAPSLVPALGLTETPEVFRFGSLFNGGTDGWNIEYNRKISFSKYIYWVDLMSNLRNNRLGQIHSWLDCGRLFLRWNTRFKPTAVIVTIALTSVAGIFALVSMWTDLFMKIIRKFQRASHQFFALDSSEISPE